MHADTVTEMLRARWRPPAASGSRHSSMAVADVDQHAVTLRHEDAAAAGAMNLWDILSGKVASRIPNIRHGRRPPWSAWDPCSKYRSRCALPRALLLHIRPGHMLSMECWQGCTD